MAYTTIDDPSLYFQIALYTGNGNTGKNIPLSSANFTGEYVGQDIQPDWIWIKQRGATTDHGMFDSSRGVTKNLKTNEGDAESTEAQSVTGFGSNDFTLGSSGDYNGADDEHVAWIWKANGGTTTTNDASSTSVGTIDSVFQVNSTAKFSIVTYTGNGSSGASFAHGLGTAPQWVLTKNRDTTRSWLVGHHKVGFTHTAGHLNSDVDRDEDSVYWNDTAPSSTVVTLGNNEGGNESGDKFVAYCFTEVQGYSKFGKYIGNGNADGPFVYTGFKPSLIIRKVTSASGGWLIQDNKRTIFNGLNSTTNGLRPNSNEAEFDFFDIDYLSNGFKIRTTEANHNASGETFIYMAFAEHPFVSSEGVPTTAR